MPTLAALPAVCALDQLPCSLSTGASKVPGILDATQQMGATRDGCDARWVRQMKVRHMQVAHKVRHMQVAHIKWPAGQVHLESVACPNLHCRDRQASPFLDHPLSCGACGRVHPWPRHQQLTHAGK